MISDQWLRRPVVGIGIGTAGPRGRSRPRRPAEKCGQLADLLRISDGIGTKAELRGRIAEERCIVCAALLESMTLSIGVGQRSGCGVITICLEILDRPVSRRIGVRSAVEIDARKCGAMKIFSREIRSQISAMPEDRAVLHQAVAQEDLLSRQNIRAGKQNSPCWVLDRLGNGRLVRVGVIGEDSHDQETDQQDDSCSLKPAA